jgi:hypothetical protein
MEEELPWFDRYFFQKVREAGGDCTPEAPLADAHQSKQGEANGAAQ